MTTAHFVLQLRMDSGLAQDTSVYMRRTQISDIYCCNLSRIRRERDVTESRRTNPPCQMYIAPSSSALRHALRIQSAAPYSYIEMLVLTCASIPRVSYAPMESSNGLRSAAVCCCRARPMPEVYCSSYTTLTRHRESPRAGGGRTRTPRAEGGQTRRGSGEPCGMNIFGMLGLQAQASTSRRTSGPLRLLE
ncbi:hypothetical protein K466DRAFT_328733 [Polyporus arcularius HHB13444]|uniref:Uncharacterized protein n=1 Tax=Polyporus arcularius HHB13444 TaxID=1314778 RepID=A0A5C3P064_9APHY|nr:hypothetical protein K466DRAFT_328733 [Polyporus arcularius HHB13444]